MKKLQDGNDQSIHSNIDSTKPLYNINVIPIDEKIIEKSEEQSKE